MSCFICCQAFWIGKAGEESLSFLCSNISKSEFFMKNNMKIMGISNPACIKIANLHEKSTDQVFIMMAVTKYPKMIPY